MTFRHEPRDVHNLRSHYMVSRESAVCVVSASPAGLVFCHTFKVFSGDRTFYGAFLATDMTGVLASPVAAPGRQRPRRPVEFNPLVARLPLRELQ